MKKFATLSLLALVFRSAVAAVPKPGTQWKTTLFLDDFLGGSGTPPSSENWIMQHGTQYDSYDAPSNWGTGEIESYTSSGNNVRHTGAGTLWIIPRKSKSGAWTSARIETVASTFQAPAGGKMRIESRIMAPAVNGANGLGYWPAFWAIGGNLRSNYSNWPAVGEFDIMENVNGWGKTAQTMHCGINPGGPCNEPNGISVAPTCPGSNCNGKFHTYTLIIDRSVSPEVAEYYIDQKLQNTVSQQTIGQSLWNKTVHHGLYLVLNVAMGGAFPNGVAGITTPTSATVGGKQMAVDYVAVWTT